FDYAYAEGLPTIPVRVSMFTGRYTLPFRGWQPLEQLDMPIAEILWDKGVTSALISDTYHMHKPQFGFSRGFDYVDWIRGQENDPWIVDPNLKVDLSKYSEKNWHPNYPGQPSSIVKKQFEQYLKNRAHWKDEEDHHVAQVFKASMNWLETEISKGNKNRIFLVIDSFDPHEPWDPPSQYLDMYPVPEYDGSPITWGGGAADDWTLPEIRHLRAQYAGTITLADKWTGIFLEQVEHLGLLDNTLIIFLSDHGEPLGEHGIIKKVKPWPYDELSHIPFIMRLPDKMNEEGKRIEGFVGVQDLAPTILSLFGVKTTPFMQGKNLLSLIHGEEEAMEFAVSGFHERSWSIRNHEWSYYLWLGSEMANAKIKPELYKYSPDNVPTEPAKYVLEKDQAEMENLIQEQKEVADSMEKDLREFIESLSPSAGDIMSQDFMKRQMTLRAPT
ncbi:sulfatase-like hydrolase/transferase, partial [Candidatus Bathyarchaeota archaeon]|nr:sulfatase-like hydrolase/transferase [Candidatus Bathyarchaeota archaeon]